MVMTNHYATMMIVRHLRATFDVIPLNYGIDPTFVVQYFDNIETTSPFRNSCCAKVY